MSKYQDETTREVKSFIIWFIVIVSVVSVVSFLAHTATKATHLDHPTIVYEEFQEIYNTCQKLNTDLCNMKALNENDKMFEQFSKEQRILSIKTNLNRWIEEYNAKSKMWGRDLWKSKELPHQLTQQQFSCNN